MGASEGRFIRFHRYHLADQGRVRYRTVCELEDREVSQAEIGKGYELSLTRVVPITDADRVSLPLPTAKSIEIDAFVALDKRSNSTMYRVGYLTTQERVLVCIRDHITEHGEAPTVREIGEVVGMGVASVHYQLGELETKYAIVREPGRHRGIRLA